MLARRIVSLFSLALLAPSAASAATYYVASDGDDEAAGDMDAPWATLQHAADSVAAGDSVVVLPGSYTGFYLEQSGEDGAPITFSAEGDVQITEENPETPDGINLEGASYVIVEGFTVSGMERAGLRTVTADHVTLRNNQADANGRWGILTGFVDDLLIEGNRMSGSIEEHGIYVGNSGDRPTIRGNVVWNNAANGIHMNGDAEQGGDGIISNALVEGNVIYSNGVEGGSGINCDGVQDSLIVNNLIYDAHASGISLYRIDGGGPSTGNQVINNTVIIASDGRWALNIQDDSSGTGIFNNIFLSLHESRGAIDLCGPGCEAELTSDNNIVIDRFTRDDSEVIALSDWQAATGQDTNSLVGDSAALFVDAAGSDYHLSGDSPALDAGTPTNAPDHDLDGNQRPFGDGVDVGAYEACDGDCVPSVGGSATGGSPATGGEGGDPGAGGADDATGGTTNTGGSATGGASGSGGGSGGSDTRPTGGASATGGNPSSGGTSTGTGGSATGGVNRGGSATGGAAIGSDEDSGCSCRVGGEGTTTRSALVALWALVALVVRRRARRQ